MGTAPAQFDFIPALALGAGNDADGQVLGFEDRALFDMQFIRRMHRLATHRVRAGVADLLQRLADGHAGLVFAGQAVFQVKHPGIHPRGNHRRSKTRAFFVGPVDHLDRPVGLDAQVVQGAQHFQAGKHAVDAIELAAGWLRVAMGAGQYRGQVVMAASAAGEDIAHGVHTNATAGRCAPGHEQVTPAPVLVGQGQARHATLGRATDLRHFHQRVPQALAVDPRQGAHERGPWGLAW